MRDRERELARVAVSHPDEQARARAAATWLHTRRLEVDAGSIVAVASDVSLKVAEAVLVDVRAYGWNHAGGLSRKAAAELAPGSLEPYVDVVSTRA